MTRIDLKDVSDYELMNIHVQTLYIHSSQSQLESVNDWRGGIAPRFFLGRTRQGNVWRFRQDLPRDICDTLSAYCAAEPFLLSSKPKFELDYSKILSAHAPIETKWFGPAFSIPRQSQASNESLKIEVGNSQLLHESMPEWLHDVPYQQPFFAQVVFNQAVAVCASVRITDIAHEAGVETLENHGRKGHAAAVVTAWANASIVDST